MLGLRFYVEEVVTEAVHRAIKLETRGAPQLQVIDHCRMGFDVVSHPSGSHVRVCIDYNRPATLAGRLLSLLFASKYARRCVRHVANDAVRFFGAAARGSSKWTLRFEKEWDSRSVRFAQASVRLVH